MKKKKKEEKNWTMINYALVISCKGVQTHNWTMHERARERNRAAQPRQKRKREASIYWSVCDGKVRVDLVP